MAKPHGKALHQHPPPEGRIRRSQAISTYGPGALVDLVDHAVVVGGLDHWQYDPQAVVVKEPRLREALVARLRQLDSPMELSIDRPFLMPPTGNDQQFTRQCGIRAFEFPRWFVCQNPSCRALLTTVGLEWSQRDKRYLHSCQRGTTAATPVRFVMACRRGHLDDVDWRWFVHRGAQCTAPSLQLSEGNTRDFSEIRVACGCGASRYLVEAFANPEHGPKCYGKQPWLGSGVQEECDERLRLLVRTASNAYFPQVVSSLSIPEAGNELRDKVSGFWSFLKRATANNLAAAFELHPEVGMALKGYGPEEILATIDDVNSERQPVRAPLRVAEFQRFESEPPERAGDLPPTEPDFFAREYLPVGGLPAGFARLVRAHRLREVQVQIGFTRLEAPTPSIEGEYDLAVQLAPLAKQTDWLPASEISGEGLFLQLDETAVARWEGRPAVRERAEALAVGFQRWASEPGRRDQQLKFPGVRFYLLHSLSHLVMSALAIECGYGVSALSERIYCAGVDEKVPMAALLIKTGTPGAEGTLGGLVAEGRRLRRHLQRAYDSGTLCSHDPVCAGHEPKEEMGDRHLDGAACYSCLYLAESACEQFNRFLDRALVVPVMGAPAGLAFMRERP